MPYKRRQNGKGRGKPRRVKDLSSEDTDSHDQVKDITDSIARKRLVKSSTDTEVEQHEQKENCRRQHGGDGYDADFEISEFDTTSGSDMDCQTLPTGQSEDSRHILSPNQRQNKRLASKTSQGSLQKRVVMRQGRQQAAAAAVQDQTSSLLEGSQKLPGHPELPGAPGRRHSKRKTCSTGSTTGPSIRADPDSLLQSPDMMFSLPNGSDSSTPLSAVADSKSEVDSCFGFEELLSPPQQHVLAISPVLPEAPSRPIDSLATSPPVSPGYNESPPPSPSPSMDLILRLSPSPEPARSGPSTTFSSMHSRSEMSECTSSYKGSKRKLDVNLTGLVQKDEEKGPPKKAVKKKKTQKKKEESAWTMKMSAEFDDIEMFELTVE